MKYIFLIGVVFYLVLSLFIIYNFFKHYKKEYSLNITNYIGLLSFGFLSLVFFSFFWFLKGISYDIYDFLIISSVILFVQLFVFYKVVYNIKRDKKIFFYFLIYLLSFVMLINSFYLFLIIFNILSYFLFIVIFIYINYYFKDVSKLGNLGLFYSLISIIFGFLLFIGVGEPYYYFLISNFFYFILIILIINNAGEFHIRREKKNKYKSENYILLFLRYFVFMIAICSIVLLSTIGIHELGHVLASKFFNCNSKIIVYDQGNYPYSELVCPNEDGKVISIIFGIIFPLIIALILFLTGGVLMKEISLLIIGFNLLSSYQDFADLSINNNLIIFFSIIGLIFLFLGVILVARSRISQV